ncbi:MAG: hypothetical protein WAX48_15190 [Desulfosalsimonadaceae bacterium]
MRQRLAVTLLGFALVVEIACTASGQSPVIHSVTVGGTSVVIPSPAYDLVEAGDSNRQGLEMYVGEANRLLCAFLLTNDIPRFANHPNLRLSKYALAFVGRRSEYMDCGPLDFQNQVDAYKQSFKQSLQDDASIAAMMKDVDKSLDPISKMLDTKVLLDKPVPLGVYFSKEDAFGYGMATQVTRNEQSWKMAGGFALLRVRQRQIVISLYTTYEGEQTLKWLRVATERWADEIIKTNE